MMLWALLAAPAWGAAPTSVWVYADQPDQVAELQSLGLGFTEIQDGSWWLMHADAAELDRLHASRLSHRLAEPSPVRKGAHRNAVEMHEALDALADTHREAVQLMDIGLSAEGRPITALRLSRTDEPVRSIRILGAHHGDETSSAEVTYQTA
ncbi:MAG: M14 family zinc carboxypeptidase, partial [Myxococcota bacterium]|nr:M14 family zinc carboxypeptidase [Myxococcota bacterium]